MGVECVLGFDVGTSSSKGVLVDGDGRVMATATARHRVSTPAPGRFEMDADIWWAEFVRVAHELREAAPDAHVTAIGASGMGPCVVLADEAGAPLRAAILYGIDMRATREIDELTARLGQDAIRRRGGSALSTQAVGPKLAWLARHEPDVFARARKLLMPSSFLVHRLTGDYVLDHHSASQCDPLYDMAAGAFHAPWWDEIAGGIEMPALAWPGDVVGTVTEGAAAESGLPAGIPVIAGTIDAWAEAASAGATRLGDLMLMYGTTMFLIATTSRVVTAPTLWSTAGITRGTHSLAGGMAASGAITTWLDELAGGPGFASLTAEAAASPPGARGLLTLPYFSGERTPIADPQARGIIAGLTVSHVRGDLYRSALEATAFGVRHNVEAMRAAGASIDRIVAVGGGTQGGLWTQIVSDVTGLRQVVPRLTIGASYGMAMLTAAAERAVDIDAWNPAERIVVPDPARAAFYDERYPDYLELYRATSEITHRLAASANTAPIYPEPNP